MTNIELVTIAVFLEGGQTRRIDTEDVAIRANGIAPGRFNWRKYPEQISIDRVRKRLWDATKPKAGEFLVGSERAGWALTPAGLGFAQQHVAELDGHEHSRKAMSRNEQRWLRNERIRMLSDKAFEKFISHGADGVSLRDAEAFFRLDLYVKGEARERKVIRFENAFGDDPDLGNAVNELATRVRKAE